MVVDVDFSEMNKVKKCTVIISAHNASRTIIETIESCFACDNSQLFDVVIVDDASTDNTNEKLKRYVNKTGRNIKIIENKNNLGLTKSLNKAIDVVETKYIARLDADDVNFPGRLQKQIDILDAYENIAFCSSAAFIMNDDGEICRKSAAIETYDSDSLLKHMLTTGNPFVHSTLMFRRDNLVRIGKYDEKLEYRQDYELLIRMLINDLKYHFLPEPLVGHRLGSFSISSNSIPLVYGFLVRFYYFYSLSTSHSKTDLVLVVKSYLCNRSKFFESMLLNERAISSLRNDISCTPLRFSSFISLFVLLFRSVMYLFYRNFKPILTERLRNKIWFDICHKKNCHDV